MIETAVLPEVSGKEIQNNERALEQKRPRLYFCTTIRYCNYHLQKGSKMVKVQNDKFRPGRLVFCFLWDDVCDANAKSWADGERDTFIG